MINSDITGLSIVIDGREETAGQQGEIDNKDHSIIASILLHGIEGIVCERLRLRDFVLVHSSSVFVHLETHTFFFVVVVVAGRRTILLGRLVTITNHYCSSPHFQIALAAAQ